MLTRSSTTRIVDDDHDSDMTKNGRRERRIWKPDVRKDVEDELSFHLEMRQREPGREAARLRAGRSRRGAAASRRPERGRSRCAEDIDER